MPTLLVDQRTITPAGVGPSEMQRRILRHLAHGLTGAQIAERLAIPEYGVWNRATSLYGLLGVGTATRAVVRGHELGFLSCRCCPVSEVSPQWHGVLRRLAVGDTDRELAARWHVHVSRMRHRLGDMYRAMGVRNRPQAVHAAHVAGVIGGGVDA